MYELTPRKEKKRAREREREREGEGEKKGKGQNFRRRRDEIRFYLPLERAAILDGVGGPTVPSGIRWSGIMNKLATFRREKDRPCGKESPNYRVRPDQSRGEATRATVVPFNL